MKITVYGPGCAKCKETEALVRRVVAEAGSAAEVEKVDDLQVMMKAGLLSMPAVAVDGKVVIAGRVPKEAEIRALVTGEGK
jgi:small redox-active disulfide protein 2